MKEIEVKYFILGVVRSEKGRYFAQLAKKQSGVSYACFDEKTNILTIRFTGEADIEFLQDYAYFRQCKLIDNEVEIRKQLTRMKRRRLLESFLTIQLLCISLLFVYIVIGLFTGAENESELLKILLALVALALVTKWLNMR